MPIIYIITNIKIINIQTSLRRLHMYIEKQEANISVLYFPDRAQVTP